MWEKEQAFFPNFHPRKGIFYSNGFTGSINTYAEFKVFQSTCHDLLHKLMEVPLVWNLLIRNSLS